MSDILEPPDWSRLPHDPAGFFGLGKDFDRRDLKREYSRLIRRFKPELFPQEFQRIRAAYEELELRLRYGSQSVDQPGESQDPWRRDNATEPSSKGLGRRTGGPLHERLQRERPEALYRELSDRSNKSEHDFFALAVLSDCAEPTEPTRFARWLLEGISQTHDRGLVRLLYHYLRGPIPADCIVELLESAALHLPEDAYFPVTEPLWKRLLNDEGFPCFRETLRHCEGRLAGINIVNRVIFYIQILRSAMWHADPRWNEAAMKFVEENFRYIPRDLESDVDLLVALQSYIAVRDDFRRGSELCDTLDDALQAFFAADQVQADQKLIGAQLELLRDDDEFLRSFSADKQASLAAFYPLWEWASHDVAERNLESAPPRGIDRVWVERIWKFLESISYSLGSSRAGLLWTVVDIFFKCLYVCFYLIPIALLIWLCVVYFDDIEPMSGKEGVAFLAYLASIVGGAAIGYGLSVLLKRHCVMPFDIRQSRICYATVWRRGVLELLKQSHLHVKLVAAQIASVSSSRRSTWAWLYHYLEQDFGLAIYSIAQRFLS